LKADAIAPGFFTAFKKNIQTKLRKRVTELEDGIEGQAFTSVMTEFQLSAQQVRDVWQWVHHGKDAVYENGVSGSSTDLPLLQEQSRAPTEEEEWLREGNVFGSSLPTFLRRQHADAAAGITSASSNGGVRQFLESLDIYPSARASTLADLAQPNQVSFSKQSCFLCHYMLVTYVTGGSFVRIIGHSC
jgi:hypothetical protein